MNMFPIPINLKIGRIAHFDSPKRMFRVRNVSWFSSLYWKLLEKFSY